MYQKNNDRRENVGAISEEMYREGFRDTESDIRDNNFLYIGTNSEICRSSVLVSYSEI
jgi:hypothetical protein